MKIRVGKKLINENRTQSLQQKKDFVKQAWANQGVYTTPATDQQPQPGLEGPFQFKDGRVLYYDPKVGQYYDQQTDMYVDNDNVPMQEQKVTGAASSMEDWYNAQIEFLEPFHARFARTYVGRRVRVNTGDWIAEGTVKDATMDPHYNYGESFAKFTFEADGQQIGEDGQPTGRGARQVYLDEMTDVEFIK